METDAITDCIAFFDDRHPTDSGLTAKSQLAALTARIRELEAEVDSLGVMWGECDKRANSLEPQWLPAGQLPDAEGWWLWWDLGGSAMPHKVFMKDGEPWSADMDGECSPLAGAVLPTDRFAKMPAYTAPDDGENP